jgi:addiction module HigA family antidote
MNVMFNPPHPGEVLREYLDGVSVTAAANALGVTRANISRILNGHTGISADMAIRLNIALDTSPEFWLNLQNQYDLWVASQRQHDNVQKIFTQSA